MTKTTRTTNGISGKLLKILDEVNRPGSVCFARDLPLTMPGLEVREVGAIRLPLGSAQAKKLIQKCEQAPYGKGTQTLVDTKVRRVWELEPERFKLTNPRWDELIASITSEVQAALGLEKSKLSAHLYKLLVYEEGSFFLPHRDGEKLDGMVATLVIALPSPHSGGELIVSHEGRRHEISFTGAATGHELSYAAFYADCEHEVRPVMGGHRLCLVYNLTLARSRGRKGIAAPRTGAAVTAIGELLGDWPEGGAQKIAVALDHQYSQKGLMIDTLKGVDRARAEVLFDAAGQAGCEAHLALITHWQSGSAEGGDYDYYPSSNYRRRQRYDVLSDEDYDEDEDDANALSGYEMGDIYDEGLSVNHWSDRAGKHVSLGEMGLDREEIVSSDPPEAWTVSREEFEGYTGNAGMTLERWYHRAAVVIWPQESHFAVLSGAGTDTSIAGFEVMMKKLKRARKSDRQHERQSCMQFAKAIIDSWAPRRFHYSAYHDSVFHDRNEIDRSLFPILLQDLDAPELVCRFLSQVLPQDGKIQIDKSFLSFCQQHSWPTFESSLTAVIDAPSAETIARNIALLEFLCLKRDKDTERIVLCRRLAERVVAALEKLDNDEQLSSKSLHIENVASLEQFDDDEQEDDWRPEKIDRASLLASLIKSLLVVGASGPLDRLINCVLSDRKNYELTKVHLRAIFALERWLPSKLGQADPTISRWLADCRCALENRTARAPSPPPDFRRDEKLSCKCDDCRELSRFLADPHESVHQFPRAKDRRQHLHQVIDSHGCDLTHVTTRKGRPYTLVCTKTTASYERACKIYSRDQENLKTCPSHRVKNQLGRCRAYSDSCSCLRSDFSRSY